MMPPATTPILDAIPLRLHQGFAPVLLAMLSLCALPAQAATAPPPSGQSAARTLPNNPATETGNELQLAQNTGLPPGVHGKRAGPAEVAPVIIGPVSYGVLHFGKAEGLDQNGGYIEAQDRKTGARLWTLKVYDNHLDPALEGDVQDVFITSLKRHGHTLDVVDEKGRHYRVDVRKRSVRAK